jgi:hypothetical protein
VSLFNCSTLVLEQVAIGTELPSLFGFALLNRNSQVQSNLHRSRIGIQRLEIITAGVSITLDSGEHYACTFELDTCTFELRNFLLLDHLFDLARCRNECQAAGQPLGRLPLPSSQVLSRVKKAGNKVCGRSSSTHRGSPPEIDGVLCLLN